jgi:hypothetical protein
MPVHKSVHLCLSYIIRLFARITVLKAISVIPPSVHEESVGMPCSDGVSSGLGATIWWEL